MENITQELLKEFLHYDPGTGIFSWRKMRGGRIPGTRAGYVNRRGYRRIKIFGREYKAHRLAWFYIYGRMPDDQIDHSDGNPSNDRISNLREATNSTNQQNKRISRKSTTGIKGVCFHKSSGWYRVQISKDGERHDKYFKTFAEATAAVTGIRNKLHGEFARHS